MRSDYYRFHISNMLSNEKCIRESKTDNKHLLMNVDESLSLFVNFFSIIFYLFTN